VSSQAVRIGPCPPGREQVFGRSPPRLDAALPEGRRTVPSWGYAAFQSDRRGAVGRSLVPPTRHAVHRLPGVPDLSRTQLKSALAVRVCRTRRLARPFRAFAKDLPPVKHVNPDPVGPVSHAASRLTLLSFLPLQRMKGRGSVARGTASPATVRPQRFSRSRRLSPPYSGPGLFHPGDAHGVLPSGPFPCRKQDLSRGHCSLAVTSAEGRKALSGRRLQSVAPPASPYWRTNGLGSPDSRCPHGLSPL
jgi:hypothetical protein